MDIIDLHPRTEVEPEGSLELEFKEGSRHEVEVGATLAEPLARLEPMDKWIQIRAREASLGTRRAETEGNVIEISRTWTIDGLVDVDCPDLYRIYGMRFCVY